MEIIKIDVKKCNIQLEGIEIAEKILNNIMLSGIYGIDRKGLKFYKKQVDELGSYHIKGIQKTFMKLIILCENLDKDTSIPQCIEHINYTYVLLKRAKTYIQNKRDYDNLSELEKEKVSYEMFKTSIEEQIGYTWKISELKSFGFYFENIELVQVAYTSYTNDLNEFAMVGEQILLNLLTGEIYKVKRAENFNTKFTKKEEVINSILKVESLYLYPSEGNQRVKLGELEYRELTARDLKNMKESSRKDFKAVLKEVKSQIRNPLNNKNPIYNLKVYDILSNSNNDMAIFDDLGNAIPLKFKEQSYIIKMLKRKDLIGQSLVCYFDYDVEENMIYAVPVSIINSKQVISLFY